MKPSVCISSQLHPFPPPRWPSILPWASDLCTHAFIKHKQVAFALVLGFPSFAITLVQELGSIVYSQVLDHNSGSYTVLCDTSHPQIHGFSIPNKTCIKHGQYMQLPLPFILGPQWFLDAQIFNSFAILVFRKVGTLVVGSICNFV